MTKLDAAVRESEKLRNDLQRLGLLALGGWDNKDQVFSRPWTIDSVRKAYAILLPQENDKISKKHIGEQQVAIALEKITPTLCNDVVLHTNKKQSFVICPRFHSLIGTTCTVLSLKKYLELNSLFEVPHITTKDQQPMLKILPYLHQALRMVGNVMTAENFKSLVEEEQSQPSTFSGRRGGAVVKLGVTHQSSVHGRGGAVVKSRVPHQDLEKKVPLTRLDGLVCLLATSEWPVQQDLLRKLSVFPGTLPLIMPSVFERGMEKEKWFG
jgi:hypothetical protein